LIMSHEVHVIWGSVAAGLYRSGILDMGVRLAHSKYDFGTALEGKAFLRGVSAARDPGEWAHVHDPAHVGVLGPPLIEILLSAVKRGDVRTVVHLLDIGVDPNQFDASGRAPIHYACAEGHDEVVGALVDTRADLNLATVCVLRVPVAHMCVMRESYGHISSLRRLVSAGARVTDVDIDGNSALHYASAFNNAAAVTLLVGEGAYLDGRNRFDATALEVAGDARALRAGSASDDQRGDVDSAADRVRDVLVQAQKAQDESEDAAASMRWRKQFHNFGFTG
jgi:hypothetical protein